MAKGKSKQVEDPVAEEPTDEEVEQAAQAAWDGQPGHRAQVPEQPSEPSPRELINALLQRVGRVQAIRGGKVPQLVVMSQDLREHLLALESHPALDEKRP